MSGSGGLLGSLLGAATQAMGGAQGQQGGGAGGADWTQMILSLLAQNGGQGGEQGGGGGLGGLLHQLQAGGLGEQLQSWISTGANQPVSSEQLNDALGGDAIGRLAEQAGVSHGEAGSMLSQMLPQIIDKLSPNGQLPQAGQIGDQLGGLLGGLLGGKG